VAPSRRGGRDDSRTKTANFNTMNSEQGQRPVQRCREQARSPLSPVTQPTGRGGGGAAMTVSIFYGAGRAGGGAGGAGGATVEVVEEPPGAARRKLPLVM
jgi:hypothetical protein